MAPERNNPLRHVWPLVNRWQGGRAELAGYTVSLKSLAIGIEFEGRPGNLEIACGDVSTITGPIQWDNAQIEIERAGSDAWGCDEWIVRDRGAGFEVRAGVVSASENSKRKMIKETPFPRNGDLEQVLALINRWQGGSGKLWEYSATHRCLVIRVEFERPRGNLRHGNLHVGCNDVSHITGPTKWPNAQLEIERVGENACIVRDRAAGLEIRAGSVGAAENCEPVY